MKKHRFTWIDGLVIAVILLLVAGTAVKFLVKDHTAVDRETVRFSYQLKIEGVRQYTVDALQVGDVVYDNEGKGAVGVIQDIQVSPAVMTFTDSTGEIREATGQARFDVVLTLAAEGTVAGKTYKVGTYTMKVNRNSVYFTKYSIWSATVTGID